MSDYAAAMAALRDARDALNAADLAAAEAALRAHDAAVREAVSRGGGLAVSEMEHLAAEQGSLLAELGAVQRGVARGLADTRKGGHAARAYLGMRHGG